MSRDYVILNSQASAPNLTPDGPFASGLPIVIGVTGHRDVEDVAQLERILREEIGELISRHPHTPFAAMSALAEGADRTFAKVVLEREIPLYVPLPLPAKEYEKDFPESVEEFRALCARAYAVFTVPYVTGVTRENSERHGLYRHLQYAQAGIYLARRSHVLFAIWDGKNPRGLGGTAQIVRFRRTGRIQDLGIGDHNRALLEQLGQDSLLDDSDVGLVCHIHARRRDQPPLESIPSVAWLRPQPHGGPVGVNPRAILRKIDDYNKDLKGIQCPQSTSKTEKHLSQLEDEIETLLNDDATSSSYAVPENRRLKHLFEAADRLANHRIVQVRQGFKRIFLMGAGMVLSHELYAELWPLWQILLVYLALLAGIAWEVLAMRRAKSNTEAVDRRALSEALRVQRAFFLAGLPSLVAHLYLRRDSGHLTWVRYALMGTGLAFLPRVRSQQLKLVQALWLKHQVEYFKKSIERRELVVRRLHRWGTALFLGGTLLALMALAVRILMPADHAVGMKWLDWLIGVLPAGTGLFTGYVEFAGYEDDIREQIRLKRLFEVGSARLASSGLLDQQELLRQLGIEALHENASWALLHKTHNAKAPVW